MEFKMNGDTLARLSRQLGDTEMYAASRCIQMAAALAESGMTPAQAAAAAPTLVLAVAIDGLRSREFLDAVGHELGLALRAAT